MRELTDIASFVQYLQSTRLRYPELGQGRGYSPYRSLEFDCPCGRRHELKKNQYGFLATPGPISIDPSMVYVRPQIFLGGDQVLISCSDLQGLVCISVKKGIVNQSAEVSYFISFDTLNEVNNGFGLLVESKDGVFDFNEIGQQRKEYPTKNFTTQIEFEEALLMDPIENIAESGRFVPQLEYEYFDCPCGSSHAMGGISSEFSLVQYGTAVTVPLLAIYKDLNNRSVKSALYRCPARYTMIVLRPSRPALWSAKIPPITKKDRTSSQLPQKVFDVLQSHSFMAEMDRRFSEHKGSN